MDVTRMDALLGQLKAGAALAAGKPVMPAPGIGVHESNGTGTGGTGGTGIDFSTVIRRSLDQVNHAQQRASGLARDFEIGAPDANLTEAMIAMQKASLSFQYTLQVRNKLVSAYQEIMNMPV